jgi:DNA-binding LacI/PurR family transcriptional regulator
MQAENVRTMEELAAVSGISRPTLSKYFNDPNSVRASTRKRIEAALERYDYTPNIYAINQNRQATRNIGIIVPYLADPFFSEVARQFEPLCTAAGYRPILLSSHGDPAREVENLESLRAIRPAGVLLAPLGRTSRREELHSFAGSVPTVLFDSDLDGVGDAFVGSDNMQSVALVVDHLCETAQPPAFLEMEDAPNPNAVKRHNAYEAAMRARGLSPWFLKVPGEGWEFEAIGYRAGLDLIGGRSLPTDTVLCSNDRLAIGFLAAAYEKGVRVGVGHGAGLRVAGHDDHPYASFTCPQLTTVAQDYQSITETSMQRLLAIIDSAERPEQREATLYDGTLVLRNSA